MHYVARVGLNNIYENGVIIYQIALCVKPAILQMGISVTLPTQFPPDEFLQLQFPLKPPLLPQELPRGQVGAAPKSVISLMLQSHTAARTPVKPLPEIPPLVVKIVTV